MKTLFFAICLLTSVFSIAQECEPCGERTLVNFQQIEWMGIQKPEDSVLLNEWDKLNDLWHLITQRCATFFQEGICLYIKQSFRNVEMIKAEEDGEEINFNGSATLQHPSEVMFYLGSENEPPSFMWNVQYPASNGNIAGGGAIISKADEGVKWVVNKINDAKSLYKTEYLLSQTINFAEKFKKADKAMKDLFGFNMESLPKVIDPTKPGQNPAGASGSQTITVRILSPYEDLTYKPKK